MDGRNFVVLASRLPILPLSRTQRRSQRSARIRNGDTISGFPSDPIECAAQLGYGFSFGDFVELSEKMIKLLFFLLKINNFSF